MPHYRNGREAKLQDQVIGQGYNTGHPISGVLVDIRPGPSCNVTVAHTVSNGSRVQISHEYGQADEFMHADDVKMELARAEMARREQEQRDAIDASEQAKKDLEAQAAKRDELAGEVKELLEETPAEPPKDVNAG
jgi:hypothetical protein